MSLNIRNMNLLIRFNKAREIFSSVTRVLSIFLSILATSASVERTNLKGCVAQCLATCARKPKVPGSCPTASYAHRCVLCSNSLTNV